MKQLLKLTILFTGQGIEFKISFENNRTVSIDEMSNKIKYSFNNCYQIFVYNITAFTYLLKFRIFEFWYSLIVLLWRSSILCLFSSPEPKLQMSFSDQNSSAVFRWCRRWRRCHCRKHFIFSSSPGPHGQFQRNLCGTVFR